jgi:WD40 repeat protein
MKRGIFITLLVVLCLLTGVIAAAQGGDRTPISAANAAQVTELRQWGHGSLRTVAWSPDSRVLATGGSAGVRLYDAADLTAEPRPLNAKSGPVAYLAFSPDGQTLATSGQSMLALWDVATGNLVRVLGGNNYSIGEGGLMAFSPDAQTLAYLTGDRLMLWDVATGAMQPIAAGVDTSGYYSPPGIAFSPDGTWLAWTAGRGVLRVWDTTTGQLESTVRGKALPPVFSLLGFTPDNQLLIGGGCSFIGDSEECTKGGPWLLDSPVGELRRVTEVGALQTPSVNAAAGLLVEQASRVQVSLVDLATGETRRTLLTDENPIWRLALSPDGTRLAGIADNYTREDSILHIWYTANGEEQAALEGTSRVTSAAFSPDETRLAAASMDGLLRVWDVQSGSELLRLQHDSWIAQVVFSSDGQTLLSRDREETVRVWDANTGELRQEIGNTTWLVQNDTLSSSGVILISPDSEQAYRLWDPLSDTTLLTIWASEGQFGDEVATTLNPDGRTVAATTDYDNSIHLYDAASGVSQIMLQGHTSRLSFISYNADGTLFLSTASDGTVRLWDTRTGAMLRILETSGDHYPVEINPDSSLVAIGGYWGSVRLRDVQTGDLLTTLIGHNAHVRQIVFSPSGAYLATASQDGTVRLWGIAE